MQDNVKNFGQIAGRFFLGIYPLIAGLDKIFQRDMYVAEMTAAGMPFVPLFLLGATVFLIAGSLSIMLGYRARLGALALLIFIVPASLIFHTNFHDKTQIVMLLKNISIIGGLLLVTGFGSGSRSLDERLGAETAT